MKKLNTLIIAIGTCFFFLSCDLASTYEDYPKFDSPSAVFWWVSANIKYVSDQDNHGVKEFWQGPEETLNRMTGDCEDFAILTMWLLQKNFGIEATLIAATKKADGGRHAMIEYAGKWYTPQAYPRQDNPDEWTVDYKRSLNDCLMYANFTFGSRSISNASKR